MLKDFVYIYFMLLYIYTLSDLKMANKAFIIIILLLLCETK